MLRNGPVPVHFLVRDQRMVVLSAAIRERRAKARLAYTFDPGLKIIERVMRKEQEQVSKSEH